MSHLYVGRYQTASGVESGGELLVGAWASRGRLSVSRLVGRSIGRSVHLYDPRSSRVLNLYLQKVQKRTDIIQADRFGPPNESTVGIRRVENHSHI